MLHTCVFDLLFIVADKARAKGEDVKRCRCAGRDKELKLEQRMAKPRTYADVC